MKRPKQEWCESHLEYIRKLETYIDYLESMTTKPENLEECSHDRKTDDNNGKPNDTLPRTKKTPDDSTYLVVEEADVIKEFIKDLKSGKFNKTVLDVILGVKQ